MITPLPILKPKKNKMSNISTMKKPETAIYYLVDRQPSDFIMQGTEKLPNPIRLDAPREFRMPNTSITYANDKGRLVSKNIRFLYGVNDIDVDKQRDDKVEVREGNEMDQIYFLHGKLAIVNEGTSAPLFAFMEACVDNAGAPNRPDNIPATFYRFQPEQEALEAMKANSERLNAMKVVDNLYEETPNGLAFDLKRINFLCKVFNVVAETESEKVAALMQIAQVMPIELNTAVNDRLSEMKATIADGYTVGALMQEGNKVYISNGDRRTEVLVFPSKIKTEDERMLELSYHFNNTEDGVAMWRQLLNDIDYMKKKQL